MTVPGSTPTCISARSPAPVARMGPSPAICAWFIQTLWLALNSYFGRDIDGLGGYVL